MEMFYACRVLVLGLLFVTVAADVNETMSMTTTTVNGTLSTDVNGTSSADVTMSITTTAVNGKLSTDVGSTSSTDVTMSMTTTAIDNSTSNVTTSAVVVCRVDGSIDYRASRNNVYECPPMSKCCMEGGRPSCCVDSNMNEELRDQATLWGAVVGATICIGVVIWCCRRDFDCCEGDEDCRHYVTCGCCKKGESEEYRKLSSTTTMTSGLSAVRISDTKSGGASDPASLSVQDLQATQAQRLTDTLIGDHQQ